MHRNLDRRVEVLVSITNPAHIAEIEQLFDLAFDARTGSWWLSGDGTWHERVLDDDGVPLRDLQEMLINRSTRRRAK
jgi:polyphosphate kinase